MFLNYGEKMFLNYGKKMPTETQDTKSIKKGRRSNQATRYLVAVKRVHQSLLQHCGHNFLQWLIWIFGCRTKLIIK